MIVCNKCFLPKCNCKYKGMVEIDDDILIHIKTLNDKGYTTLACCSGHIDSPHFQCYILFGVDFDKSNLPNNYVYKNRFNSIEYYIPKKEWESKSYEEKKDIMINAWDDLLEWCLQL